MISEKEDQCNMSEQHQNQHECIPDTMHTHHCSGHALDVSTRAIAQYPYLNWILFMEVDTPDADFMEVQCLPGRPNTLNPTSFQNWQTLSWPADT